MNYFFFRKVPLKAHLGAACMLLSLNCFSQKTTQVKGVVSSSEHKQVADAKVELSGLDTALNLTGTTQANGFFTLKNVPANKHFSLKVTATGYNKYEIENYVPKLGNSNTLLIELFSAKDLDEVTVTTALGIKRKERALGFSVQTVDGSEVSNAPTNGAINALQGKIAGLNLTKIGGPMGSSRVILRGEGLMDFGGGEALIVVDGTPINTSFSGTGHGSYLGADSPVDFGSALTDIDPNDIESISVLKGPTAAALYGSRAGAGAILITTKKGNKSKGLGVSLRSNLAFDDINRWPDYQYEYGQGSSGEKYYSYGTTADGSSTKSTSSAWGAKFDGQSYFQYDPTTGTAGVNRTPWVPYKNNRKDFFRTGVTSTNSITLSSTGSKTTTNLGLSYLQNDWILPNTGYKRVNVNFSSSTKANDKLSFNYKFNYANKFAPNLPSMGYDNQSIMYFMMFQNPNVNLNWYKPYWVPGTNNMTQTHPFSSLIDNPYLIVNEMLNKSNRHNFTGNVSATYKVLDNLTLTLRTALDAGYEFRTQQRPFNTQKFQNGMYRQQSVFNYQSNSDFLIRYDAIRKGDFKFVMNFGGNSLIAYSKYVSQSADNGLVTPGVYNLANSAQQVQTSSDRWDGKINSFYGFANLSYKEKIYLDLTGRNDWNSTLPLDKHSYFFPSASVSAILSSIFSLPKWVSYAKIRASYASVGQGAPFGKYSIVKSYGAGTYPGELSNPSTSPNGILKPQRNNSWETGAVLQFLQNRISADITYYHQNVVDQILSSPVDPSSGFGSHLLNMGSVLNKGIEVTLTGTPVKTKDFNWTMTVNWSKNNNKVEDLNSVTGNIILASYVGSRVTVEARQGMSLGQIYGKGFQRYNGQIIFDKNGNPMLSSDMRNQGSTIAAWKGSVNNSLTYKNFSFSFLIDHQQGGRVFSLTNSILGEQGKIRSTLPGRYDGIVGQGVMLDNTGNYVPNTTKATDIPTYYNQWFGRDNVEANTFSASYWKLREVAIYYTLPQKWVNRTFIQKAAIGIYGRDVFNWTKFPGFDPEVGSLDNATTIPGLEIGQFPSTRTLGVNIQVQF